MRQPKVFHVYIMRNRSRSHVLYTGVTGDLSRRVFQHKNKLLPGFTSRYNLTRLAYYECFFYPDAALAREKEIKGWRRSKKIRLIESMNAHWDDLAERWSDTKSQRIKPPAVSDIIHYQGELNSDSARRVHRTIHSLALRGSSSAWS